MGGGLILLLGPPIAFAFALGLLGGGTKRFWMLGALVVAVIQALSFVGLGPSDRMPAQIGFSVIAPWFAVEVVLVLSSLPRHSLLMAFVIPLVFAVMVFGGVILGVNVGLLPL
jgi:hypothetical protein